jgi:DeoR family transcriptional regulator, suf operon transcriptional repressor
MTGQTATTLAPAGASLVRLLGAARAAIITDLREHGERSVAQLAELLDISDVATRRHLTVLEDEGFVSVRTVKQPRGRPAARYELTDEAHRLFPHRYDQLAAEMMDFLAEQHGRDGLRTFLKWRLERETADLREAITAEDLHERLEQLATRLSDAGFAASIEPADGGFRLVQNHCAIADVAREHPEVCAYEAAAFSKVLGRDVTLSRRDTLATGAGACVCTVSETPSAVAARGDASVDGRGTNPT